MRICSVLLLLAIAGLCFSLTDPPIVEVTANNIAAAERLMGFVGAERNEPSVDNPVIFSDIRLLTAVPSVDKRISADEENEVVWTWGEMHADHVEERYHKENGCDDLYSVTFISLEKNASTRFLFRDKERIIVNDFEEPLIPVPFSKVELNETNGEDWLEVELHGVLNFTYQRTDSIGRMVCTTGEDGIEVCSCETEIYTYPVNFVKEYDSRLGYAVEGGSVLYFLRAPVLVEQWFRNNHFDNLLFSKRKFYRGIVERDGVELGRVYLYNFSISMDEYGLQYIHSFPIMDRRNVSGLENFNRVIPRQIEKENESFIYLYEFNSSYNGSGGYMLRLEATDHFLNSFHKESRIKSRKLTFNGNRSETGEVAIADDENYRGSIAFTLDALNDMVLTLGWIGVMIVLLCLVSKKS